MLQVKFLRLLQILQQRPAGAYGAASLRQAGIRNRRKAELPAEPLGTGGIIKRGAVRFGHRLQLLLQEREDGRALRCLRREDGFPRLKTGKLVQDVILSPLRKMRTAEFARRELAEGDARIAAREIHRTDVVAAPFLQHRAFRHGARGNDADDVPLHQPLCQCGVFRLLADGDLVALRDEPCNIALGAVIRHAAHGGALLRVLHVPVPGGQGQVQLPRGDDGVLVEHLVEVAEAEEEQAVPVLFLDLLVLALHRGQLSHPPSLPFRTAPRCCRR